MSDKIARLGIERDNDLMYYLKNGDVWATPRKQPGQPKGKARKVADVGLEMDYSKYLYFLDGDGDVARKARHLGGGGKKRVKTKAPKAPKLSTKTRAPGASGNGGGSSGKTEAQIAREVEECLAKVKGGAAPAASKSGSRKKKARA